MLLVRRAMFGGEDAFLLKSIDNTWDGGRWLGWLTVSEADIKEETVVTETRQKLILPPKLECTAIQLWRPPVVDPPKRRFERLRRWLAGVASKIRSMINQLV